MKFRFFPLQFFLFLFLTLQGLISFALGQEYSSPSTQCLAPNFEFKTYSELINEMGKSDIDQYIDEASFFKKGLLLQNMDSTISYHGGLKYSPPQIRYAYFKLLQNRLILLQYLPSLVGISDNSKKELFLLLETEAHDLDKQSYHFSKIAVSVFHGMIEDNTFIDFCEYLQNENKSLLPGAPNIVLVDCERKEGYPGEGLFRISSFLELFGFQVQIISAKEMEKNQIPEIPFHPHIIGKRFLTATLQDDIDKSNQLLEQYPNSLLIGGGHEITGSDRIFKIMPEMYAATMGWGEFTLTDILVNISIDGDDITKAPNASELEKFASLRTKGKTFRRSYPIDNKDFRVLFQSFNPKRILTSNEPSDKVFIHSSSHCTEKCTFCMAKEAFTSGIGCFQKVLTVTPQDIIHRLKRLEKHLPELRDIEFSDDNFLAVRRRTQEFFALLEKHGFAQKYDLHFETRLNNLNRADEDDLRHMASLGTRSLTIGLESPLLKVVKNLRKGKSIYPLMENFKEILRKAKRAGIPKVYCFIILFTEEETMDDSINIMRTLIDLICEEEIVTTMAEALVVFPGTELFQRYRLEELDALRITINNEKANSSIKIPTLVLPKENDNHQYVQKIQGGFNLDQYRYLIRDEYSEIILRLKDKIDNHERRMYITEALFKLHRIHLHLIAIERLFLTRSGQASRVIQELRYKRDEWLDRVLDRNPKASFPSYVKPAFTIPFYSLEYAA